MKILIGCLDFILQLPGISWAMEKVLNKWQYGPNEYCPLIADGEFDKAIIAGHVIAVALISYGTKEDKLTNGSWATTYATVDTGYKPLQPSIAFGSFFGDKVEENTKKSYLSKHTSGAFIDFVGPVTSTTDECLAILRKWRDDGDDPEVIVVVAEGCHARRARAVWQHFIINYFPGAYICFRVVDARDCEDPQNSMLLQRYWRVWLLVNILLLPFYKWWPGVDWFAKHNFAQPTGE